MSAQKTKHILVTGGAGFVGSHLCEALLERGHTVFCLDNFFTGLRKNIAHLENNPHFTFIEHDICNAIELDVDAIYNLACPASPNHYQRDPIFTTRTCFLGALNMLELARRNRAKILQASTSEIYGDPLVHPQSETYRGNVNPMGPRACYDEGKRVAETLFFDYSRSYGVDTKVARIFNTYGPRMQKEDGRVITNLLNQALENHPLTLYGDGTQTRSFCYVDDLVQGLIALMESGESGPINLGNPVEMSISSLAELILDLTGSSSALKFCPLPADDPKIRCPDITKAKELLGWQPKVSVEEGLKRILEFVKSKVQP